jgi:ABC-type transport system involved in multi-copper enzyme maturation permease subunit
MTALLRADWLRLRRRRDFWVIAIAVVVLAALTFFAGWRGEAADPEFPSAAQIRQEAVEFMFFEGTPEEIAAQVDQYVADQLAQYDQQRIQTEAQQAIDLQKYGFPQSVFTVVGSGTAPLLALVLVTSLAVGDEFRFGTIRTSLLAAGDRRQFLAARLISLFALTVGLTAALVALGALLGLLLGIVGADVGVGSTPVDPASSVAWLGGQVLVAMTVIALAAALTVLLRSGALPLLLILIAGLAELFVANLPIFAPTELLAGVPQAFLTTNIQRLGAELGLNTHALALARTELRPAAIDIPLLGVAAIVAAWGVLFLVLADRRLRTMDVVE